LSASFDGANITVAWPAVRSDLQLQYATDLSLGNWTTMAVTTNNNNQYTATDATGDSQRFYRLMKPAPGSPIIPSISVTKILASSGATNTTIVNDGDSFTLVNGAAKYTLNALSALNARTGTAEALSYHWLISYPTVPQYTDAGIHGYRRSALYIEQFALAATAGTDVATVTLTVTDNLNPLSGETQFHFNSKVTDTSLSLSQFNNCQQPNPTGCTDAAALPPSDPNDPR
jgi:hypothetical protein